MPEIKIGRNKRKGSKKQNITAVSFINMDNENSTFAAKKSEVFHIHLY